MENTLVLYGYKGIIITLAQYENAACNYGMQFL